MAALREGFDDGESRTASMRRPVNQALKAAGQRWSPVGLPRE
jgi:hypothetical protein